MNYFVKYKFAIWTIIILSVMVLSVAGTMMYFRLQGPPPPQNDREQRRHQAMQAFMKDLNLDAQQEQQMRALREQFFKKSRGIYDSMETKRQLLLNELAKPAPDTVVMYAIAEQMGKLQTQLKRNTINHLMGMRAFCTPEQIEKLKVLNNQMLRQEGGPGKRRGQPRPDDRRD
jgi:Spy/CpxP family protein refolding chaperone